MLAGLHTLQPSTPYAARPVLSGEVGRRRAPHGYDADVKRILPVVAAFALVIAGVGGAIVLLASRDHSSLDTGQSAAPNGGRSATLEGPYGLPLGNVVVTYSAARDRIRIDQLAERLGAIDTKPSRAAGQALVSKADPGGQVVATNGTATQPLTDATDPRLAEFVRQYLGRIDAP